MYTIQNTLKKTSTNSRLILTILFVLTTFLIYSCKKDKPAPPVIITTATNEISYTTAVSGGNVVSEGGSHIVSRGVCWGTSPDPTIDNKKTTQNGTLGFFNSNLTMLIPNTRYYVRAFAMSGEGTGYGDSETFTTLESASPSVITNETSLITQTTALSGGNVTGDNGGSVTARGVCWGTSIDPTISGNKTSDGSGNGSFSSTLTGLLLNTKYYIKAYATNSIGTSYGVELSFTTLAELPAVTTSSVTGIFIKTATGGGTLTSNGGGTISAQGVCWSTNRNPTIADNKTSEGTNTASYESSFTGLLGNTTYYVRAYATNNAGTAYGNEVSFTTQPPTPPILTTSNIANITLNSASGGGIISDDGGGPVTDRGICWSISQNPTLADHKTSDGIGNGSFISSIIGLDANTAYHVKAYATNSSGTGYGNELIFNTYTGTLNDMDGNVYYTVTIGSQIWMAENLRTTKSSDGTAIPFAVNPTIWSELTGPGYTWYNNDDATYKVPYGAIYNWYAVNSGKLCPNGSHIPTDSDWSGLVTYLGGEDLAGGKLKEISTIYWDSPNAGATNEFGFTALAGGERSAEGAFNSIRYEGYWWSATEYSTTDAYFWTIISLSGNLGRNYFDKNHGLSVRCIKD